MHLLVIELSHTYLQGPMSRHHSKSPGFSLELETMLTCISLICSTIRRMSTTKTVTLQHSLASFLRKKKIEISWGYLIGKLQGGCHYQNIIWNYFSDSFCAQKTTWWNVCAWMLRGQSVRTTSIFLKEWFADKINLWALQRGISKKKIYKTWWGGRVRVAKSPCKIFLILVHWLPWYSVSDSGPLFLTNFHLFNTSNLSLIYSAENACKISKFGLNL